MRDNVQSRALLGWYILQMDISCKSVLNQGSCEQFILLKKKVAINRLPNLILKFFILFTLSFLWVVLFYVHLEPLCVFLCYHTDCILLKICSCFLSIQVNAGKENNPVLALFTCRRASWNP